MSVNLKVKFDSNYLVGGYVKRQGRVHRQTLADLGLTETDIANIRKARNNIPVCADLIGKLAKASFMRDLENRANPKENSLAKRVKYITAHVYNGSTILWDAEIEKLTQALNEAIDTQTEALIKDACSPRDPSIKTPTQNSPLKDRIQNTRDWKTRYDHLTRHHQQTLQTSPTNKKSSRWSPIQRFVTWLNIPKPQPQQLQAAHHTHGILTRIIGSISPHQIRTKMTSHFQVTMQPKYNFVGKKYQGLTVSFLPTDPTQEAKSPIACTPLKSLSQAEYTHACIPIEIQTGETSTKWIFIEVNDYEIPPFVRNWLMTTEGLAAQLAARRTQWSTEDEMAEAHYRYETTHAVTTTKQHTIFDRHVYVSAEGVLLGREHSNESKYAGLLGRGGFNNIYLGKTVDFTDTAPFTTSHIVRKALQGKEKTATRLQKQRRLYTLLEGSPNVGVPQMISYHTMGSGKEKMLEVMPCCNQGSLECFFSTDEFQLLNICLQAARGLSAIHQKGIWHGDIKPENILAHQEQNKPIQILISDIDDAAFFGEHTGTYTPDYLAPECISGWRPTPSAVIARDSYALGVTLYQVTHQQNLPTRNYPFFPHSVGSLPRSSAAIVRAKRDSVIAKLLDPSPSTRITVQEAFQALDSIHASEIL